MKGNIVVAVGLIVLCVIGWLSFGTQKVSQNNNYNEYVQQADEWVKQGLYQRAIEQYRLALEEKNEEAVYEKIVDAYKLRYAEEPKKTYEDFLIFLEESLVEYPTNVCLVKAYVELCKVEDDYEVMYNCLKTAIDEGCEDESIQKLYREVRYTYTIQRNKYSEIRQSVGSVFTIKRKEEWNIYNINQGYLLDDIYEYVGLANEDGAVVITGKDSRLIDGTGMVLGIFKDKVSDAGVYSDGLVAISCGGKYSYYNDFAKKQFGEYEFAGMFQDEKAAVKKDGKWMLIDTEGQVVSDKFTEIIVDYAGRYLCNDTILVREKEGQFVLYDEKFKDKITIKCDDVDINSKDGLIAILKKGKWGFINSEGEIVIEPMYDEAKSFSNGVAAVCKDGKWGFIDKDNILVIDYQFAEAMYMCDAGVCPIQISQVSSEGQDINVEWSFLELVLGITEE